MSNFYLVLGTYNNCCPRKAYSNKKATTCSVCLNKLLKRFLSLTLRFCSLLFLRRKKNYLCLFYKLSPFTLLLFSFSQHRALDFKLPFCIIYN